MDYFQPLPFAGKVLFLEDNYADARLIERQMRKIVPGAQLVHVPSFPLFKERLVKEKPHIILSDYRLGSFSGLDVLRYAEQVSPETPFIFVTGAIKDQAIAAQSVLSGASGFVLKNDIKSFHKRLYPIFEKLNRWFHDLSWAQSEAQKLKEQVEQFRLQNGRIQENMHKIKGTASFLKDANSEHNRDLD